MILALFKSKAYIKKKVTSTNSAYEGKMEFCLLVHSLWPVLLCFLIKVLCCQLPSGFYLYMYVYLDINILVCIYVCKTDVLHNDKLENSLLKGAEGGRESSSFLLRLPSYVLHSQMMHLFKATHLCQMHRVKSLITIIIFSKQNHPLFLALESAA